MSDKNNPFEGANPFAAMMAQAQEMAKSYPAMEAFSPKGFEKMMGTMPKDMMEMMFGNTLNEGGLDARTRMLLTLAGLTMQGAQNDVAFRQAVRHAVEAGATKQHIVESIGQMSMFAGLPAMTRALELAQQVLDEEKDA
ncbi:carboxymuconolactone decarboxylase family protein [Roseobacter denitrificans]|uniref:Carboxymuconolactone decarboxylase n=1 Tax=Roseobacter denitrificans (strain ATCC 33942 / OCh 114) TaxID=375451 RepID=Q163R8_ROSDO|nr:carboxymuconolactone decarboxylase family protein [Roseobacter denitrificans]ABG32775.1 carboxymuconolactone decarboxylase [Roseobacter denitrificans OCh 114]AVL52187.1 carboxymuconolactone decarboxylase family protein [Roseobacter denitrificans]SFF94792.1 4-carboxymuconolactone decarboxylase [Roseobacter denitrificans OCh 114]